MTKQEFPTKVIQFGEGNFLRAFVDWMIDILNEKNAFNGSVAVVQPLENGLVQMLAEQNCHYHHVRQGLEGGQKIDEIRKITSISKAVNPYKDTRSYFELAEAPEVQLVFSNTTEAGIVFDEKDQPTDGQIASSFPGKLTQLLKQRFDHFNADESKGLAVVPCELIEQNGTKLKQCVNQYIQLWGLGGAFQNWVDNSCSFANTLVDRIVPGYPKEEIETLLDRIGELDKLVVKSEAFHLFVIQAEDYVKELFPAHQHGLNVKYVSDITPYRTQKVRILNGAHTSMVPIGLLYGLETVSETIDDPETGKLINELIYDEIVPTISIPGEDPKEFADAVINRFQNPFIRHELISISLNSISKFKVRVLPTFKDYLKHTGELPKRMTFSLACLLKLYTSGQFDLKDDQNILNFFDTIKVLNTDTLVQKALSNSELWGEDLTSIEGLTEQVIEHFESISSSAMKEAIYNI
ncbi:tagaturonate reductase [Marinoscillum sp.]|uniref:tagaturonate reductase n=1 Tax=Marinoscillum sp. TaxID=2024838 RepID=UPI003BA874CF